MTLFAVVRDFLAGREGAVRRRDIRVLDRVFDAVVAVSRKASPMRNT